MLVAAGADSNPTVGDGKRLMDLIAEACQQKGWSLPAEPVIAVLEKLNGTTIDRWSSLQRRIYASFASRVISALRSFEIGQPAFALAAHS